MHKSIKSFKPSLIIPSLEKTLKTQRLLLDGGLSNMLESNGCDLSSNMWTANILKNDPKAIYDVHLQFLEAGADIITSSSYQASFPGFRQMSLDDSAIEELLKQSVILAKEARDNFWHNPNNRIGRKIPFVAASIGPYGAFLADGSEYDGNYDIKKETLQDFHAPRLQVIMEENPDILAIETIPNKEEAILLADLLQTYPSQEAWMSFTIRDAEHISDGTKIATLLKALEAYTNIKAIGFNCCAPGQISHLLDIANKYSNKAKIVYPNGGQIWNAKTKTWSKNEQEDWKQHMVEWQNNGAKIIGGCCQTSAQDISEMRKLI